MEFESDLLLFTPAEFSKGTSSGVFNSIVTPQGLCD